MSQWSYEDMVLTGACNVFVGDERAGLVETQDRSPANILLRIVIENTFDSHGVNCHFTDATPFLVLVPPDLLVRDGPSQTCFFPRLVCG